MAAPGAEKPVEELIEGFSNSINEKIVFLRG